MANRALKKTAKVLGGLGAAYVLSDMLGPKVTGVDPEVEAADREATRQRVERNRVDGLPAPALTSRKKGGAVKASRRADGIAQRGKTRGKMV
jgi:hypothetical protein